MRLNDLKDYKKDYIIFGDFEFDDFERIELLLFLVNYLNISGKIEDYYLILGGRGLISRHSFNNGDYFIQNARILLKTINQKKVFIDELIDYENNKKNTEKLYVRSSNRFVNVESNSGKLKEKEELYLKLLSLEIKYALQAANYAFQDGKRYGIVIDDKPIEIKLPKDVKPTKLPMANKNKRGKLVVSIEDLIKKAKEMDDALSKDGDAFRRELIENNSFKVVKNGKLYDAKDIEISKVTNIIGQVGAGKSTFSNVVIKKLTKEKVKILLIEPSVAKILAKSEELIKLGIKAVPVIGTSAWKEHIERVNDGKDFLRNYDSKILTAGCPLGGLIQDLGVAIEYGKEPCTGIYKFYGMEESKKNQLNKNEKFKCPYYYICPRTKIQGEIPTADVIVTTTAGLSTMTIGISGVTLFQYALDNIDLVILDEAESELQKVDKIFAPYISYDDYIRNNGSIAGNHYKKPSDERASSNESHCTEFIRLHGESDRAFTKMHNLLEKNKQGFNKSIINKPFSAKSLVNYCKDNNKLPLKICTDLENMIGLKSRLYKGLLRDLADVKNEKDLLESFDAYNWGVENNLSIEQVNMIIFIGAVLYFEYLYRNISNLVEGNVELPMSTKAILSQRFEFHQRYIPVSPKGNIFAIQYKEKDGNGKSDLYVIKQFAMGRAMYLRFPWLNIDSKGEPNGPSVMLLSGSSFAPGSFANHISEPVDYIIEAEDYKRRFISESHFEFLDYDIRVSGSTNRDSRLRQLTMELKDLILDKLQKDNNNILMIVNSYEDAEVVKTALKDSLKDTDYIDTIAYLVSDNNNEEDYEKIKQSKVSGFTNKGARILVAPAILIERGHNIVDDNGNAAFDTLIFMTRPMGRPNDYTSNVSKVNGHIMIKYSGKNYGIDTNAFIDMRKDANTLYNWLENDNYSISDIKPILRKDIVVTLFVMILQIFGRLCRIGNQEKMKSRAPEVYFADGAFKAKNETKFDFLNELVDYLDEIMNLNNINGEVSKTLYEPFYNALKKGRHIYGKR